MPEDRRERLKQWLASGEARLAPLTHPQRELWEASPVAPSDPANHICCLIKVRGLLIPEDCRVAVQRVVERQEALRVSVLPGKDQPLQLIRRQGEVSCVFRQLTGAEATPERLEDEVRTLSAKPFDLVQGPLHRVEVLTRGADDHVIVLSIHHAIADGWSLGVFVRDLCGAYVQGMMGLHEPLPPVELPYLAWAVAERTYWQPVEVARRLDYWRTTLEGATPVWSGPAAQSPLRRRVSEVPAPLTQAVRQLAKQNGSTLFSTLLSIFQMTLARQLGVEDLTVGTPVANRHKANTRETMGYFAGNVPLRGRLNQDRTISESIAATHQSSIEGFGNALPFADLCQALGRTPAGNAHPVYDVRFALQNHPVPDVSVPSLSARLRMRSTGTPRCELGCEITEVGETLELVWLFRENRMSGDEVEQCDRLFRALLQQACDSPAARISTILALPL